MGVKIAKICPMCERETERMPRNECESLRTLIGHFSDRFSTTSYDATEFRSLIMIINHLASALAGSAA